MRKIEKNEFTNRREQRKTYVMCDEVLTACAIDGSITTKTKCLYTTVNCEGGTLRGQSVVDWHDHLQKQPNCTIVLEVNEEKYWNLLKESMQ